MLEWPTSSGKAPEYLETDAVRLAKLEVPQVPPFVGIGGLGGS